MKKFLREFKGYLSNEILKELNDLEEINNQYCIYSKYKENLFVFLEEDSLGRNPQIQIEVENSSCIFKLFREVPPDQYYPEWEEEWNIYFSEDNFDLEATMKLIISFLKTQNKEGE